MEQTTKLTKRVVDAATPEGKRYRIWDTDLKGFCLRVTPSGVKTFCLVYRPNGGGRRIAPKEYTIGKLSGSLTPDAARNHAGKLLSTVRLGGDPQEDKNKIRAEATLNELIDQYMTNAMPLKKPSSQKSDTYRINAHIRPLLGKMRVSEISEDDIQKFMIDIALGKHANRKISKAQAKRSGLRNVETRKLRDPNVTGGKGTATRTVITLSAIMTYATKGRNKLRLDNPCRGIKKFPSNKSYRFLDYSEFARLGEALEDPSLNIKAVRIIRLWVLTGARKMEIQALQKSEIDFALGFLKLKDSKTGQKIIQLGKPALEVLKEAVADNPSIYVFPSDKDLTKPFVGTPNIWRRIRTAAKIEDVRIHDLRHSFASLAILEGKSLAFLQKILGHQDPKTTSRYAHLADTATHHAVDDVANAAVGAMKRGQPTKDAMPPSYLVTQFEKPIGVPTQLSFRICNLLAR